MSLWTFFGVCILILIVTMWVVHNLYKNGKLPDGAFRETYENMLNTGKKNYDNYFNDVVDLYTKTVGHENNETAKMAYNKAVKKDEMYSSQEKKGEISKNNIKKATTNSFIAGDLLNFNIAPNQENLNDFLQSKSKAANFYNKTLNRINNNPTTIIQNDKKELPPEFMINRVENFYDDYITQLNQYYNGIDNNVNTDRLANIVPDFNNIRNTVRNARIKNIKNTNKLKVKAIENYFGNQLITNDPQNVHDSQVSTDVVNIYKKLIDKNNNEYNSKFANAYNLEDIRQEIESYNFEKPENKDKALLIFNKVNEKNYNTILNTTEDKILLDIWKRINSSENKQNQKELKSALFDSMADSIESDHYGVLREVCLRGRCNRMLQSLTLLDNDQDISKPIKTTEILKNEVFSKSYKTIQDELTKTEPEIAAVYNGKQTSDTELNKKVSEFEDNLKKQIEINIRNDYTDKVQNHVLENLIKDAVAGV